MAKVNITTIVIPYRTERLNIKKEEKLKFLF